MEKNNVHDEKLLEQVNGGRAFPSVNVDGSFSIQCPFCGAIITGSTKEECMEKYESHRKTCYSSVI